MAINDILSDVVQTLGLKDSEIATLKKKIAELEGSIRNNNDRLNDLKEKILKVDEKLRVAKVEYQQSSDSVKAIIKRQIQTLFKEKERFEQDIHMFADRVDTDSEIRHKLSSVIYALENPSQVELIGDTLSDMEQVLRDREDEDKALEKLSAAKYERSSFEEQLADIDLDGTVNIAQSGKEEDEEFLKQLESISN